MTTISRSTDTDDTIRVTVTLRRESHPELFALLKNVQSGRARGDIVRQHLNFRGPIERVREMALVAVARPTIVREIQENPVTQPTGGHNNQFSSVNSTGYVEPQTVNFKKENEIHSSGTVDYKREIVLNSSETVDFKKEKVINSSGTLNYMPEKGFSEGAVSPETTPKNTASSGDNSLVDVLFGKFGHDGQFPSS